MSSASTCRKRLPRQPCARFPLGDARAELREPRLIKFKLGTREKGLPRCRMKPRGGNEENSLVLRRRGGIFMFKNRFGSI